MYLNQAFYQTSILFQHLMWYYQLSTDSIEKDVILQVTQVTEKLSRMQRDVFELVDSNEEFKNVSIYEAEGKYIVGQYNYDVVNIPFEEGIPRRESRRQGIYCLRHENPVTSGTTRRILDKRR